ncbi:MAG: hypothetical protein JXR03_19340, partial [Cyclobacteriaceae bacterium]
MVIFLLLTVCEINYFNPAISIKKIIFPVAEMFYRRNSCATIESSFLSSTRIFQNLFSHKLNLTFSSADIDYRIIYYIPEPDFKI